MMPFLPTKTQQISRQLLRSSVASQGETLDQLPASSLESGPSELLIIGLLRSVKSGMSNLCEEGHDSDRKGCCESKSEWGAVPLKPPLGRVPALESEPLPRPPPPGGKKLWEFPGTKLCEVARSRWRTCGMSAFRRSGSAKSELARCRLGGGVGRGISEVGGSGRRRELARWRFWEKVGDDETFTPSCSRAEEINSVME